MALPIFKDDNKNVMLLQTNWAQQLNPVLINPLMNGHILKGVSLVNGTNTINHLLGRKLQGYYIVRQRASASIYDNQDNNSTPDLTLVLVSSGNVSVDIAVF